MWLRCLARATQASEADASTMRAFEAVVTTLRVVDVVTVTATRTLEVVAATHPYLKFEGYRHQDQKEVCQREEFCYFTIIKINTKRHPFYTRPHFIPYTPPHDRRHTTPHHTWTFYLTPAVLTRYCQVAKCTTIYNDFFSVSCTYTHTPYTGRYYATALLITE